MKKEIIERLVLGNEEMKKTHICPRCGKAMNEDDALNSLSRYADVYICSNCGTDEAMRGLFGGSPMDFSEWQIWKELLFSISSAAGRKTFSETVPSGIYTGKNADGEEISVRVEDGKGMVIMTEHAEKPNWLECIEYNEKGEQCGVCYEPKEKE